jgi:hypothetical protein
MAGKTDRQRGLERLRQVLCWNLAPFHSDLIGGKQRRLLGRPVDFSEWPSAGHARLPVVPRGQNVFHQAVLRSCCDLRQALLSAPGSLRPPRTLRQPQSRADPDRGHSGVPRIHPYPGRTQVLRALDDPASAIPHARADESPSRDPGGDPDGNRYPLHLHIGLAYLICTSRANPARRPNVLIRKHRTGRAGHRTG